MPFVIMCIPRCGSRGNWITPGSFKDILLALCGRYITHVRVVNIEKATSVITKLLSTLVSNETNPQKSAGMEHTYLERGNNYLSFKKISTLPKLAILSELDFKKQGRKMRPRPALRHFQRFLQKRYRPTDQRTDGPTDTPSYRDARKHLKTAKV